MNEQEIAKKKMEEICKIFDISIADVEQRLADLDEDGLLVARYDDDEAGYKFRSIRYYDIQGLHLNRFYYALASLVLKDVKNVLEIGTGDALSTIVLSKLFPNASIFTIDLPQGDPRFNRWRQKSAPKTERGRQRQERLNRGNITFFEKNTFFLLDLGLPREFEFILVDGDHTYPQIAGDIMFAYSRIVEDGFLFIHDYYETNRKNCRVGEVVDWMEQRIPEKVFIFPMATPPGTPDQKMAVVVKGLLK